MMIEDAFTFDHLHPCDEKVAVLSVREEAPRHFKQGARVVTLDEEPHRGYFGMESVARAVRGSACVPDYRRWLTCDEGSEAIERVAKKINAHAYGYDSDGEEGQCESEGLPAVVNFLREDTRGGVWLHPELFDPFVNWLVPRTAPTGEELEKECRRVDVLAAVHKAEAADRVLRQQVCARSLKTNASILRSLESNRDLLSSREADDMIEHFRDRVRDTRDDFRDLCDGRKRHRNF
eukprot:jgi/Mesvir1/20120/Mv13359-RA.1